VTAEFLVCPLCAVRLKERCGGCGAGLEPLWEACPRCATSRSRPPVPASRELVAHLLAAAKDAAEPADEGPADRTPTSAPATEAV
jgi:hypothetical protein